MGPRKKFQNLQAWFGVLGQVVRISGPIFGPALISKLAKNIKNGLKQVQNRWFGLKIGTRDSYGRFGAVRTGPVPKKSNSIPKNRQGVQETPAG